MATFKPCAFLLPLIIASSVLTAAEPGSPPDPLAGLISPFANDSSFDEPPTGTEVATASLALDASHTQPEDYQTVAQASYIPAPVEHWLGDNPGYPTVIVSGFFQADSAWFFQTESNREAVGDIQNGADFRRTRLNAHGDAAENVGYMIEMDFSFPGHPSFMDVFLDVRDIPWLGTVRIGQWRQPFGMDELTSVKELVFLERALPFAFAPFRQIGAGFFDVAESKRATWALSAFRYPTDPFGGQVGDDGGYGLAGRFTFLPIDEGDDGLLVHLGGGYSFANPANNLVRFRNQPEIFVGETAGSLAPIGVPLNVPVFVDTGDIPTLNFSVIGAEFAADYGSMYAQSELMYAIVNQEIGSTATFWGAYAQVAYILTGEHRPYNRDGGVFGRIVPDCDFRPGQGKGAWEIAGRWSCLELNDDGIQGGRLNDLTFGLNWYLNAHTKFQFNYIHPFLDDAAVGKSEAGITAVRAQVDF